MTIETPGYLVMGAEGGHLSGRATFCESKAEAVTKAEAELSRAAREIEPWPTYIIDVIQFTLSQQPPPPRAADPKNWPDRPPSPLDEE